MNASRYRPNRTHLKPIVLALALVVPETAVLAASMDDVVRTRSDQNIDQQYGRDSVYAFSADAKPLKPEQTGSRDTNLFSTVKDYAAAAWHKTEEFALDAWNKTTGAAHETSDSTAMHPEYQGYGRAGGYVGAGRIAVLESNTPNRANATPNDVVTGNSSAGTGMSGAANSQPQGMGDGSNGQGGAVNGQQSQAGSDAMNATAPAASDTNGRTSGDRFDHADSAHGQR
jgi:hypothetical protein